MRDAGNSPQYYCGGDDPTPEMQQCAHVFFSRAAFDVGGLNFRRPRRQASVKWFDPAAAKPGLGKLWLECFRAIKGDRCVLFPFRTAYHPRGTVTYNFRKMEAHRAMCLMVHKLPPEGKTMALHSCGNGHIGCVNPNHLYWGDVSDNGKDARRHRAQGKPIVDDSGSFVASGRTKAA